MGRPLGYLLQYMPVASPMLYTSIVGARLAIAGGDASRLFAGAREDDPVYRAEQRLWAGSRAALSSPLCTPITGPLIAQSFFSEYPFSTMARDEEAVGTGQPPPSLESAWQVAASAGPWWPYASGIVISDRPVELHVDAQGLLHREDGPAVVYRDGALVYAWHGLTVPEDWILHPEAVPAAKLRGFDAAFRTHAEASRKRAGAAPRRQKPSAILGAALPADHGQRLRALRDHAHDALPLLDRYRAGEHDAAWKALMALGPGVRHDPHAADALAVAYETMHRVEANVRTLVARLRDIGYVFTRPDGRPRDAREAHTPPTRGTAKALARLEKRAGPLPLSIRVFHEVVGAVDLIGRHARIVPDQAPTAPDPLVVAGPEEALDALDGWDDDEPLLIVAPDDLHKANTSGGDPVHDRGAGPERGRAAPQRATRVHLRRGPAAGLPVRRLPRLRGRRRPAGRAGVPLPRPAPVLRTGPG